MKEILILNHLNDRLTSELENFINEFGNISIWQTPLWNQTVLLKRKKKWFILIENSKIIGFCVIEERYIIARIYFGPIYKDKDSGIQILNEIAKYYRKSLKGLIYIQPEISCSEIFNKESINKLNLKIESNNSTWATKLIELNQTYEYVFKQFNQNHKRSIKKALDSGFIVKKIEQHSEFKLFYSLYKEMHEFRKIKPIIRSEHIFLRFCEELSLKNRGLIYGVINANGEILGATLFVIEGSRLLYQFGATNKKIKDPLLHLIFDFAIKDAQYMGFNTLDLGGYAIGDNLNSQTQNINRFKDGFNGALQVYPESIILEGNFVIAFFVKIIKNILGK